MDLSDQAYHLTHQWVGVWWVQLLPTCQGQASLSDTTLPNSGVRHTLLEPWLCHLLVWWPSLSYFASLSKSVLKRENIAQHRVIWGWILEIKCVIPRVDW